MTLSTDLEETALKLAEVETDVDLAVTTLLERSGERRVSVVLAEQHLKDRFTQHPDDPVNERAVAFIEEALKRGSWSE
jgi:hypothetical protein